MRFGDWIALAEVGEEIPEVPGLFQIRIRHGWIVYPSGKSPMFYYGYAANLREGIEVFRRNLLPELGRSETELLLRWMEADRAEERFRSHLRRFVARFGSLPEGNARQLEEGTQRTKVTK